MSFYFPDPREVVLWERVGTLAWIMGAKKSDNPFRRYLSVLGPGPTDSGIWGNKLRAWDRGWEKAAARYRPRAASGMVTYLPRPGWSRLAFGTRRRQSGIPK